MSRSENDRPIRNSGGKMAELPIADCREEASSRQPSAISQKQDMLEGCLLNLIADS
jgi:hypothetical protein